MGTVIGEVRDPRFATAVTHLDRRQSEMRLLLWWFGLWGPSLVRCEVQRSMTAVVVGGCDSCRLPGSPSIHDVSFALGVQAVGTVVGAMSGPTFHDSCCGRRL